MDREEYKAKESKRVLEGLPPTWVWTSEKLVEGTLLYFARDSRWEPNVPDIVDSSRLAVAAYAWECF